MSVGLGSFHTRVAFSCSWLITLIDHLVKAFGLVSSTATCSRDPPGNTRRLVLFVVEQSAAQSDCPDLKNSPWITLFPFFPGILQPSFESSCMMARGRP